MNKIVAKILVIICLFGFSKLSAQVNDAGLWISLDAEKKITQKFSAEFSQNFRLNENMSELGTSFSEVGLSYKLLKPLKVGAFYRYSQQRRVDDFYSKSHRYSIYASYKFKYKNFKINLREQFQSRYKDIGTSDFGYIPKNVLRSKISVSYDLNKKYSPFLSYELFYEVGEYIDNLRYKAGFDYELDKMNSFNLYYMIDKEMNVKNPWTSYVVGLGYNITF